MFFNGIESTIIIIFLYFQVSLTQQTVNVPYLPKRNSTYQPEAAIFYFGSLDAKGSPSIQVRMAWSDEYGFNIWIDVLDHRIVMPENLNSCDDVGNYDGLTLYLDLNEEEKESINENTLKITRSLTNRWGCPALNYCGCFGYADSNTGEWVLEKMEGGQINASIPGMLIQTYKTNLVFKDGSEFSRGWQQNIFLAWSWLGMDIPEVSKGGRRIRMALEIHDKDSDTWYSTTAWPKYMNPKNPKTWARIVFGGGLCWNPPSVVESSVETIFLTNGVNGTRAPSTNFGGGILTEDNGGSKGLLCPGLKDSDDFHVWGKRKFGEGGFMVQNQGNIDDFPCFARSLLRFPLNKLDKSKVVINATLRLNNWGGSNPSSCPVTFLQVATVRRKWTVSEVSWNYFPQPIEYNTAVGGVTTKIPAIKCLPDPPEPFETNYYYTDLSVSVSEAHDMRLDEISFLLYSADNFQDSGKYFSNSIGRVVHKRPTLIVTVGESEDGESGKRCFTTNPVDEVDPVYLPAETIALIWGVSSAFLFLCLLFLAVLIMVSLACLRVRKKKNVLTKSEELLPK